MAGVANKKILSIILLEIAPGTVVDDVVAKTRALVGEGMVDEISERMRIQACPRQHGYFKI